MVSCEQKESTAQRSIRRNTVTTLRVFKISAVREILTRILPHSFLKKEQIRAALNYLNGKITGDELVTIFDQEFELGKRRIRAPNISVPLSRPIKSDRRRRN